MFVKITWGLELSKLNYFVQDCDYFCGETEEEQREFSVPIVKVKVNFFPDNTTNIQFGKNAF